MPCELCGIDEAPQRHEGLEVCGDCAAGDVGAALAHLEVHQTVEGPDARQGSTTEATRGGAHGLRVTTHLPWHLPVVVDFRREHIGHQLIKLFVAEVQAGDPLFDHAIYVRTSTDPAVASLLAADGCQSAILLCVGADGAVSLRGSELTVDAWSTSGPPPEGAWRFKSLLLTRHILQWAARRTYRVSGTSVRRMPDRIYRTKEGRDVVLSLYDRWLERVPFPTSSAWVDTGFGPTHILVAGPEAAPPVVVLHGVNGMATQLAAPLAPLVTDHRLYLVDLVGEPNRSASNRPQREGRELADWLVEVLDGLALDRVAVLGASFGGFVALKLCAFAGQRVSRAVLLVPGGLVDTPLWSGMWNLFLPMVRWQAQATDDNLARFVEALGGSAADLDPIWLDLFRVVRAHVKLDTSPIPNLSAADLADFSAPTLVIAGGADVIFPGADVIERARRVLGDVRTLLIEDGTHMLFDASDPEQSLAPVRAFLDDTRPPWSEGAALPEPTGP